MQSKEIASLEFMICAWRPAILEVKIILDTQKLFEATSVVLHISQQLSNQWAKNENKSAMKNFYIEVSSDKKGWNFQLLFKQLFYCVRHFTKFH